MDIAGTLSAVLRWWWWSQDQLILTGVRSISAWVHPLQTVLLIGEEHVEDPQICRQQRPGQAVKSAIDMVRDILQSHQLDSWFDVMIELRPSLDVGVDSNLKQFLDEFDACITRGGPERLRGPPALPGACPYQNVRVHWSDIRIDKLGLYLAYLPSYRKVAEQNDRLDQICRMLHDFYGIRQAEEDLAASQKRFEASLDLNLSWRERGRILDKQREKISGHFADFQVTMTAQVDGAYQRAPGSSW